MAPLMESQQRHVRRIPPFSPLHGAGLCRSQRDAWRTEPNKGGIGELKVEIGCSPTEGFFGLQALHRVRMLGGLQLHCHMNIRGFLSGWCFPKVSLFFAGNTQLASIFLLMQIKGALIREIYISRQPRWASGYVKIDGNWSCATGAVGEAGNHPRGFPRTDATPESPEFSWFSWWIWKGNHQNFGKSWQERLP